MYCFFIKDFVGVLFSIILTEKNNYWSLFKIAKFIFFLNRSGNYFTYSFYHKRLTWSESRQWCQELGADLVSMETVEEWEYLTNFIQTLTGPGHVEYYIGLRKKSGEWQWLSNNTTVPGENWRWNSMSNNLRKENVHQPSGDGTCVVMYKNYPEGKQGYYNDLPCNSKGIDGTIGFICEETVGK